MKQFLFGLSFGFAALLMAMDIASAQTQVRCGERAQVIEQLNNKYGETRRLVGLASSNTIVEVYASEQTGSWTITLTRPDGQTCLVAAGTSFETIDEELPTAQGSPA